MTRRLRPMYRLGQIAFALLRTRGRSRFLWLNRLSRQGLRSPIRARDALPGSGHFDNAARLWRPQPQTLVQLPNQFRPKLLLRQLLSPPVWSPLGNNWIATGACQSFSRVHSARNSFCTFCLVISRRFGCIRRCIFLGSKITLIPPQKSLCSRLPECRVCGHSERLRNES